MSGLDAGSATSKNTEEPYWVKQSQPHQKVAVVFIHGIFGGTTETWRGPEGLTFFDYLASAPGVGDQVDVFAFGFTSRMFKSGSVDIREAANLLDTQFQFHGVWNYESIVMVAHSMGGLVALRALINVGPRREKVPLVVLYATPMEGSEISRLGGLVANNPALSQMLPADESEFLKALDDDWGRIAHGDKPVVVCAYEKALTHGVSIVQQSSATRYCNGPKIAIGDSDHITIVKPDRPTHDSVIVLVNALKTHVLGTAREPLVQLPDFREEGQNLVFEYQDIGVSCPRARIINAGARTVRYTILSPSDGMLLVLPQETPRELFAQQREELQFCLLFQGELQDEFRFGLRAEGLFERTVVVRITDPEARFRPRAREAAEAVATGLRAWLSDNQNTSALASLDSEAKYLRLAEVARSSLPVASDVADASVQWVLTADALLSGGFPELAVHALKNAEQQSPAVANLGVVRNLASRVATQADEEEILLLYQIETPNELLLNYHEPRIPIDRANTQIWDELAVQLQRDKTFRAEGLRIQGDVLRAEGRERQAQAAYRQSLELRATPYTRSKLPTSVAGEKDPSERQGG